MPIKKFTFFNLGNDLRNLAPGFGITMDYEILESLIRSAHAKQPPDHLRDELRELAEDHHCDFTDHDALRFVQFVKRGL